MGVWEKLWEKICRNMYIHFVDIELNMQNHCHVPLSVKHYTHTHFPFYQQKSACLCYYSQMTLDNAKLSISEKTSAYSVTSCPHLIIRSSQVPSLSAVMYLSHAVICLSSTVGLKPDAFLPTWILLTNGPPSQLDLRC